MMNRMAGCLNVTVAVTVVLAALVFQANCASVGMKRVTRAKVLGFDWKNCGQPDDPAVLKSLTLSPDPIIIPGSLTVTVSGSTLVELASPLSMNVTLEKEMGAIWIKIPCMEGRGSCHYKDICDILNQLIPPGQDCPEPLRTYGLPCHCPFKAGSYSLPGYEFSLPHIDLPQSLANGNYRVQGVLGGGGKELGCLQLSLSIHSN